jgi:filamentous hemagglutinin family protein
LAYAIASVLAMASVPVYAAPPPLSQAWLQQAQGQATTQAGGTASNAPATGGIAALTPTQLLQQRTVQQSLANLNNAAQTVAAQIAAQQAAQQAAQKLTAPVTNGLAPGGLVVAPGVANNPSLWQNANLPTQSVSNGQTTVQVKQTAQKAILTWNSFNVGSNTTLYFNQSGGNQTNGSNNNWIVLNRVVDPSGVPSQIFGQIKAEGTVYILNHNGILFGGGSQVFSATTSPPAIAHSSMAALLRAIRICHSWSMGSSLTARITMWWCRTAPPSPAVRRVS